VASLAAWRAIVQLFSQAVSCFDDVRDTTEHIPPLLSHGYLSRVSRQEWDRVTDWVTTGVGTSGRPTAGKAAVDSRWPDTCWTSAATAISPPHTVGFIILLVQFGRQHLLPRSVCLIDRSWTCCHQLHLWAVCLQPFSSNVISWVQLLQPPPLPPAGWTVDSCWQYYGLNKPYTCQNC